MKGVWFSAVSVPTAPKRTSGSLSLRRLIPSEYPTEWENRLRDFPGDSSLHSLIWLRTLEELSQSRLELYHLIKDDELVGMLPLFFKLRFRVLRTGVSPIGSWLKYLGPLLRNPNDLSALLPAIKSGRLACRYDIVELRLFDRAPDGLCQRTGWDEHVGTTIVYDVTQELDNLFNECTKKCRNRIRRAKKENITVEVITGKDYYSADVECILAQYLGMVQEVFERQGRKVKLSGQHIKSFWDHLVPRRKVVLFIAYKKNSIVGMTVNLVGNGKMYGHAAASKTAVRGLGVDNLLYWTELEWAHNEGLREVDSGGADIPSLARFKRTFGGQERSYSVLTCPITIQGRLAWQGFNRFGFPLRLLKHLRARRS
jgi:CelD/BcsL family acetyltransferase involved in cellulose biosynthesis